MYSFIYIGSDFIELQNNNFYFIYKNIILINDKQKI